MSTFCKGKACLEARNESEHRIAQGLRNQIEEINQYNKILGSLIGNFENGLIGDFQSRERNKDTPKESFIYIPLGEKSFIRQVEFAKKIMDGLNLSKKQQWQDTRHKFLDVGCGIGTKVLIAKEYFNAYGLELSKNYYNAAKKMLGEYIFKGNAITFNRYKMFDIIYYYCPIKDIKLQRKLEAHIYRCAKPGTMLICNLCRHRPFEVEKYGFVTIPNAADLFFLKGDAALLERTKKVIEDKKLVFKW